MAVAEKMSAGIAATWRDYKRTGSVVTRNKLVEKYLPLVRCIAERIRAKLPACVELEDLISAGVFGLMDAIDRYDLDREVKFETYCSMRIRGAILDELRKLDWVPRLVRSNAHQMEEASSQLRKKFGRLPTDEELAEALGISLEDLGDLANAAAAVSMVPFSSKFGDDENDRHNRVADMIEGDVNGNPLRVIEKAELRTVIMKELSEKERLVVLLYYFEQLTLKEIGEVLHLSESRVCQIHSKILARLEGILRSRKEELWISS